MTLFKPSNSIKTMNKNTRIERKAVRAQQKAGGGTVSIRRPIGGYHGATRGHQRAPESAFTNVTLHANTRGAEGVVSLNARRNMQMKVLQNQDENGRKETLTVHEPIHKREFITHPNHQYIRDDKRGGGYFQPKTANVS